MTNKKVAQAAIDTMRRDGGLSAIEPVAVWIYKGGYNGGCAVILSKEYLSLVDTAGYVAYKLGQRYSYEQQNERWRIVLCMILARYSGDFIIKSVEPSYISRKLQTRRVRSSEVAKM